MRYQNFEQFFARLGRSHTPALIWYSEPGERVELSGRVLENWVAKTANFMVDECEIATGDTVTIAAKTHWRTIIIALATLRVGARLEFITVAQEPHPDSETVFSFDPQYLRQLTVDFPVAVDPGALSLGFTQELASHTIDYCAEVRTHGDIYSALETSQAGSPVFSGLEQTAAELLAAAHTVSETVAKVIAASFCPLTPLTPTPDYLQTLLGLWSSPRGVLILDPSLDWEENRKQQIITDEKTVCLESNPKTPTACRG